MPTASIDEIQALLKEAYGVLSAVQFFRSDPHSHLLLQSYRNRLAEIDKQVQALVAQSTPEQLTAAYSELAVIKSNLLRFVSDGPTDSDSFLYKAYASNSAILFLILWAIVGTAAILWGITRIWCGANGDDPDWSKILGLAAMMGALGGYISCIQSLGAYLGNRQLLRSWFTYYLLFPLKGAALAVIVFVFATLGQFDAAASPPPSATRPATQPAHVLPASQQSATATSKPSETSATNPAPPQPHDDHRETPCCGGIKCGDLRKYYAIAALVGLFANQAIQMLADLFSVIFKSVSAKDRLRDSADPGWDSSGNPPANPSRLTKR